VGVNLQPVLPRVEKLEGATRYKNSKRDNDVVALLAMIRGYCCQFETLIDEYASIVEAIKKMLYYFQKPSQSNSDYHEDFMAMVEVIEEYGGAGLLMYFPAMIKKELKTNSLTISGATSAQMEEAKKTLREKFLAVLMWNGANQDNKENS
jgi:hypothetical protein